MFIATENAEGKLETSDFTIWVEKNRKTMRTWEIQKKNRLKH